MQVLASQVQHPIGSPDRVTACLLVLRPRPSSSADQHASRLAPAARDALSQATRLTRLQA
jgi:hypothetical protein